MWRRLIFSLFLISTFNPTISSRSPKIISPRSFIIEKIQIACEYETTSLPTPFEGIPDSFFACNLRTKIGFSITKITKANAPTGKTFMDVDLIIIDRVEVSILPQGFSSIFTNLKGLKIKSSELRNIASSDLEPFNGLKFLSVTENLIQFLSSDLFSSNLNLEFIDMRNNLIVFVDPNSFSGLLNLRILRLDGLQCYFDNGNAENKQEIDQLLVKINEECSKTDMLVALFGNYVVDYVAERKITEDQEKLIMQQVHSINLLSNELLTCQDENFEAKFIQTKLELEGKKLELLNATTELNLCNNYKYEINIHVNQLEEKLNNSLIELNSSNSTIKNLTNDLTSCLIEKTSLANQIKEIEAKCLPKGSCRFINDPIYGYSCLGNEILIKSSADQKVSWNGTHTGSNDNSNIMALLIKSQFTLFLPIDVGKIFPKINTLIVDSSKLQRIGKNDFKTLENLVKLSLTGNEISLIEGGSFDDLRQLTTLELINNKITSLKSKAFAKLDHLLVLNLSGNLLTTLSVDLISPTNEIREFYGNDNKLKDVDSNFVWRLRNCKMIDLTGNVNCSLKFDGSKSFIAFYSEVLGNC